MPISHHTITRILTPCSQPRSEDEDNKRNRDHRYGDEAERAEGPCWCETHEHYDGSQSRAKGEEEDCLLWRITIGSHPAHIMRRHAAAVSAERVPRAG